MLRSHFLPLYLDGEPQAQLRTSFVPFVDVKVHPTPNSPAPPIPTRATATPVRVTDPPNTSPFFPIPHHPPPKFRPKPATLAPTAATPLPQACHSHANPALNFVTPPPPAARPATPLLTRPVHPCYASSNKGPTCHRPYDPSPRPSAADAPVIVHPGALQPAPGGHPFCHRMSPKGRGLTHHRSHPGTAPQLRKVHNGALWNTFRENRPRRPMSRKITPDRLCACAPQ